MGLQALTNGLVWTFTAVAVAMVSLRLVARLHLTKAAGWDDCVIVIALIINILSACLASYAISQGVGLRFHTLPPDVGINAAKWGAIADAAALMSFTVPKLSVALLLCRILSVLVNSALKRFLLVLPAVLSITWAIGNEGFWFGQCRPTAALWDKSIPGGSCLDPFYFMAQGVALCAFSAAADIFYALFPILFIPKLHMSRAKKVQLSLMLGLGIIGGAVAIWKTTQFIGIAVPDADVTNASARLIYATLIEANLLVIAACVPTVLPVARAWRAHAARASHALTRAGGPGAGGSAGAKNAHAQVRARRHRAALAFGLVDDSDDGTARALAGIVGLTEVRGAPVDEESAPRGRRGRPAWRDFGGLLFSEDRASGVTSRGEAEAGREVSVSVRREVEIEVVHERIVGDEAGAGSREDVTECSGESVYEREQKDGRSGSGSGSDVTEKT